LHPRSRLARLFCVSCLSLPCGIIFKIFKNRLTSIFQGAVTLTRQGVY
jgi:hypothetical protein